MATTSVVVAVRQALMTALSARAELATGGLNGTAVQCGYGHPGAALQSESVWSEGGDVNLDWAAMRAGRKTRNESTSFDVVFYVFIQGGDAYTADARALAMGAALENLAADNVAALVAAGAFEVAVTGPRLEGGFTDAGRIALAVYTVTYLARLT